MDKVYNPGFAFYDTYYKAIEHLPLEQQKEICYACAKYGITYEIVDPVEMPLGHLFVINNKEHIENSVERWKYNQNKANFKIDNLVNRNIVIAQLIAEGKNSKQIAAILSSEGENISDSAVRKTEPWKDRKDNNFKEKWLGKNVNDSQNGTENVNENVREKCENSQNGTGMERENSQEVHEIHKNGTVFNF